jgi:hypothetical protein
MAALIMGVSDDFAASDVVDMVKPAMLKVGNACFWQAFRARSIA